MWAMWCNGGDLAENLSRTDLSTYLEQKDPLNSTDLLWEGAGSNKGLDR